MESWSSGGDDVAVGLSLGDLDGLLLLEDQETVKLGGCLLLVVVSAQFQQADGVCTSLSHDTLWGQRHEVSVKFSFELQ